MTSSTQSALESGFSGFLNQKASPVGNVLPDQGHTRPPDLWARMDRRQGHHHLVWSFRAPRRRKRLSVVTAATGRLSTFWRHKRTGCHMHCILCRRDGATAEPAAPGTCDREYDTGPGSVLLSGLNRRCRAAHRQRRGVVGPHRSATVYQTIASVSKAT
jgi:hypothetical protein